MANVFLYDLSDTWTTGGTAYDAIKMDVADNASAAGSDLLDLQVGSASKLRVRKDGQLFSAATVYGQAYRTTSGTIDVVTQGVYVPTGLTFTLDSIGNERRNRHLPRLCQLRRPCRQQPDDRSAAGQERQRHHGQPVPGLRRQRERDRQTDLHLVRRAR